jgi:hypothetical protein
MPATPINEAALRYSPEMALAFQPTETDRPATKKSCAVFDRLADQKPIQMVATTVAALKASIQGSMVTGIPNIECQNPKEVQNPKPKISQAESCLRALAF